MAHPIGNPSASQCNRRTFLSATLGATALAPAAALAQQTRTVSPDATPRDWSNAQPVRYPDPDIIALDNRFRRYIVGNTVIKRLYTGTLWAEGPAWNGVGRYLVWSDIPNNVQMRWIEEDGHVTRVPQSLRLQQRQHFRFRRPATFLRARWPARGPLRTERNRHRDCRQV